MWLFDSLEGDPPSTSSEHIQTHMNQSASCSQHSVTLISHDSVPHSQSPNPPDPISSEKNSNQNYHSRRPSNFNPQSSNRKMGRKPVRTMFNSRICAVPLHPLLLILISLLSCFTPTSGISSEKLTPSTAGMDCAQTRFLYKTLAEARSFPEIADSDIPKQPIKASRLEVCGAGDTALSCCSREMEIHWKNESENEFRRTVQDRLIKVTHVLGTQTAQFDAYMSHSLSKSRTDMHELFNLTYGGFYMRHSALFAQLFENITNYYKHGQPPVHYSLDTFFLQLYQRMFGMMNPQYELSDRFALCMSDHMSQLQPFGDVPIKMRQQLQRSMLAARTFHQGLHFATDLLRKIIEVPPSPPCANAMMRMSYCAHCKGQVGLQACHNLCLNVANGCLADQADLHQDWNHFIESMLALLDRLRGPFSVESVLEPINVQLSEAVMVFQEKTQDVSQKLLQGCGEPSTRFRFKRRDASSLDDLLSFNHNQNNQHQTNVKESRIEPLAKSISAELTKSKNFWRSLATGVCSDRRVAAPADSQSACWNGTHTNSYSHAPTGDGLVNQVNNPEVQLLPVPNSVVADQMLQLRLNTDKIRNAHKGRDNQWTPHPLPNDSERASMSARHTASLVDRMEEFSGDGPGTNGHNPSIMDADHDLIEGSASGPSLPRRPTHSFSPVNYPDLEMPHRFMPPSQTHHSRGHFPPRGHMPVGGPVPVDDEDYLDTAEGSGRGAIESSGGHLFTVVAPQATSGKEGLRVVTMPTTVLPAHVDVMPDQVTPREQRPAAGTQKPASNWPSKISSAQRFSVSKWITVFAMVFVFYCKS